MKLSIHLNLALGLALSGPSLLGQNSELPSKQPNPARNAEIESLEPVNAEGVISQTTLGRKAQLEAEALKIIVSGDKLRNMNDQDSAEVLRRIPGVSVNVADGNATGLVVRGIQPNLNKITVDGQNLGGRSGNDGSRGAGALNQIAPEFLESIEVTKAPTPDIDADAIGGTVNLNTRNTAGLTQPILSARVSSSYDDASSLWSHTGNTTFGMPLDTERPSGFLLSINLQDRKFERNRFGTRNNWPTIALSPSESYNALGAFETSVYTGESQSVGILANYDVQLSPETRFFFKIAGNGTDRSFERTRLVREIEDGSLLNLSEDSGFFEDVELNQNGFATERESASASGVMGIEYQSEFWEIDASLGGALASDESANQTSVAFATDPIFDVFYDTSNDPLAPTVAVNGADENDPALYAFTRVADIEETADDAEGVAQVNIRHNSQLSIGDFSIKFGTKYIERTSDVNEDRIQYALAPGATLNLEPFADPSGVTLNRYSFGPGIDSVSVARFRQQNPELFVVNESRSVLGSLAEDYDVSESVWSAYSMVTLTRGPFRWIAGVRVEHTETEASGFDINENDLTDITPLSVSRDYTHWLPGLHGRYMPSEKFALRASVTRTIARPSFRDISPYRNINENQNRIQSGNPDLQPYESDNFDLTIDFLIPKIGALQAGVFYKEIDNFIVDATRDITFGGDPNFVEETKINGDIAKLFGIELAWRNQFSWLPAPLETLQFEANYTWTSSEATIPDRDDTLRLPDQAEHTLKASLSYEIEKWSFSVSLDYRSHRLDELVRPGFDIFDSEELQIDLSVDYTLSRALSLSIGLRNLTGFDEYTYFGDEDRLGRSWDNSWVGNIGLRWKL
ncbi:MAG: TonB-dependent receptor [Verrucomicrobiota bacterium]